MKRRRCDHRRPSPLHPPFQLHSARGVSHAPHALAASTCRRVLEDLDYVQLYQHRAPQSIDEAYLWSRLHPLLGYMTNPQHVEQVRPHTSPVTVTLGIERHARWAPICASSVHHARYS